MTTDYCSTEKKQFTLTKDFSGFYEFKSYDRYTGIYMYIYIGSLTATTSGGTYLDPMFYSKRHWVIMVGLVLFTDHLM